MYKNISKMQCSHGYKNFGFIPKTFILPSGNLKYKNSIWFILVNNKLIIIKFIIFYKIEISQLTEDADKRNGKFYIVKPAGSS